MGAQLQLEQVEEPAKSKKLLEKVYDALAPGGSVAIAEFVPDDDRKGPPTPLILADKPARAQAG